MSRWAGVRYFCASVLVMAAKKTTSTVNFLFILQKKEDVGGSAYAIGKFFTQPGNFSFLDVEVKKNNHFLAGKIIPSTFAVHIAK
jgi:hypothetical protein